MTIKDFMLNGGRINDLQAKYYSYPVADINTNINEKDLEKAIKNEDSTLIDYDAASFEDDPAENNGYEYIYTNKNNKEQDKFVDNFSQLKQAIAKIDENDMA